VPDRVRKAKLWYEKWRWYERNSLPWRRLAIHRAMAAHESYARWPVHGNLLEALKHGRMEMGKNVYFDHDVWIAVLKNGHLSLGDNVVLNCGVFVSVHDRIEIGKNTGVAIGSFISDGMRRFDDADPSRPFFNQGVWSKGPTIIGEQCWIGHNSVITSGVTVGDWCIIGANSVVTKDIPSYSMAAGAPAKVVREIRPGEVMDGQLRRPVEPIEDMAGNV
jgi:acetyltransferase-like isoleucine patch superfamily enzyme